MPMGDPTREAILMSEEEAYAKPVLSRYPKISLRQQAVLYLPAPLRVGAAPT